MFVALNNLFRKVLRASRKKVFKFFIVCMEPRSDDVILDLGAAGDYHGGQPFFEDNYGYKKNIIGVNIDIDELVSLKTKYKEIPLILADGCYLPLKSKSIDIIFSNAVLEHVGDSKRQKKLADEIMRVGKKCFVTTPNFWFPIETHWKLPFIHFLPRKLQKQIMDTGRKWFAEETPKLCFKLPGTLQRPLTKYFTRHRWYGHGYYLLSARKLEKLFPTSKIKKQRTTFYPEVLIAYSPSTHETKRRILMTAPLPPTVGGITTFVTGISKTGLNKKYKFTLFDTQRSTVGLAKDVNDYTLIFRLGFICLVKSVASTIYHLLKFPFALIASRPNLVHVHTSTYWSFWENSVYIIISKLFSTKTLLHIHGGLFDKYYRDSNSLLKFLIRKTLDLPDKVIVLSAKWKEFFIDLVPENKIMVLENFVDLSRFNGSKREADLPTDVTKVLFIGGVAAKMKGVYEVLKAIPIVTNKYQKILFFFIACNHIAKEICEKDKINHYSKIFDYVHGDEKIKIFTTSDIFVLPSYSEGLPMAMLEAMASGLPVIATSVGAISEIIEEGKNGFLIKPGDHEALAERILTLAQNEELRQEMGKNNIKKIRKQYDIRLIAKKLDKVYEKLL